MWEHKVESHTHTSSHIIWADNPIKSHWVHIQYSSKGFGAYRSVTFSVKHLTWKWLFPNSIPRPCAILFKQQSISNLTNSAPNMVRDFELIFFLFCYLLNVWIEWNGMQLLSNRMNEVDQFKRCHILLHHPYQYHIFGQFNNEIRIDLLKKIAEHWISFPSTHKMSYISLFGFELTMIQRIVLHSIRLHKMKMKM